MKKKLDDISITIRFYPTFYVGGLAEVMEGMATAFIAELRERNYINREVGAVINRGYVYISECCGHEFDDAGLIRKCAGCGKEVCDWCAYQDTKEDKWYCADCEGEE